MSDTIILKKGKYRAEVSLSMLRRISMDKFLFMIDRMTEEDMQDGPIYERYTITHKDGKPVDPDKRYFVLAPDTDPYARAALQVYADECEATHPWLSKSIRVKYNLDSTL